MDDKEIEKLIMADVAALYNRGKTECFIKHHFKPMRKGFKQLYGFNFPITVKEMTEMLTHEVTAAN